MTGGLFAILDDIALLLDDAAAMTKVAAKKTAGILGDDLAVNAEKAAGFHASRELPVLWAISKGSFINKLIILPLAFLLSAFLPGLIVPILLAGGIYLSFEGVEKIWEWLHPHPQQADKHAEALALNTENAQTTEQKKIRSAIFTDFILSIEIIVIALGSVMEQTFLLQVVVVSLVALLATVGVYGFVALIVRMDDAGFWLLAQAQTTRGITQPLLSGVGNTLITLMPKVIRALSVIGTLAMLTVGGGMFLHNIHIIHEILHNFPTLLAEILLGLVVGTLAVILSKTVHWLLGK